MPKQDVKVELFYGSAWNSLPAYTRGPITITRGKGNEQSGLTPAALSLTVDARSGDLNPRDPTSPLYGVAGRNTPTRVTLDGTDVRLVAEGAAWAPRRTEDFVVGGGRGDAWMEYDGGGVLRRLGQGTDPRSALHRAISGTLGLLAHYPMEDGEDSNLAANGIPGGAPLVIQTGVINFEQDGGPAGSAGYAAVVEAPTDVLSVTLPAYTSTGGWQVSIWCKGEQTFIGGAPGANIDDARVMEVYTDTGYLFAIGIDNAFGSGDGAYVSVFDPAEVFVDRADSASLGLDVPGLTDGEWHLLQVTVDQVTGSTADMNLYVDGDLVGTAAGMSFSGLPRRLNTPGLINAPDVANLGVAHIAVHTTDALVSQWEAGRGWPGETAAGRISGLASERGVTVTLIGDPADCQDMGPQYPDTTTNLLAEAELTDSGLLFDSRDQIGLTYRTGHSLYTQTPALELNYADLAPPFDPVLDDQGTRNDVTVNRREGSSARAVQETGPMNVQDPTDDPQGVGRTVGTVDVNPATDAILPHHAQWHLHFGIVDEIRYPRVTVQALDDRPDLIAAAGAVDIGDVITIANLPADLSPDLARLIVLGYTEVIESHARRITFNCAPASVYDVGIWDDPAAPTSSRWDSDGSTTSGTFAAGTDTALSVAVTAGRVLWTTNQEHYPLDLGLSGARVRALAAGSVLNVNPFVLADATGWTGQNGTAVYSTAVQRRPEYGSLLVTPNGAGIAEARASALLGGIVAGATYQIGAWIYTPGAWVSGFRVGVNVHNGGGALITTIQTPITVIAAGAWTWLGTEITAPALTTQTRLFVSQQGAPVAANIWYATGAVLIPVTSYTASPQAFTVAPAAINGVAKSIPSGTPVRLWQPALWGL